MTKQKRIKVLDRPETWIFIDADRDEEEARSTWLMRWEKGFRPSEEQIRREREMVRGGKVLQRRNY